MMVSLHKNMNVKEWAKRNGKIRRNHLTNYKQSQLRWKKAFL